MRSKRQTPKLNTSSLPDIVFMILFFFMAIGMFPPPQPKFDNDIIINEAGTELEATANYIQLKIGPNGEIQLGYDLVQLEDLTKAIKDYRKDNPKRGIIVLSIDNDAPIGYIKNEVEPAIREAGLTSIQYEVVHEKEEV